MLFHPVYIRFADWVQYRILFKALPAKFSSPTHLLIKKTSLP